MEQKSPRNLPLSGRESIRQSPQKEENSPSDDQSKYGRNSLRISVPSLPSSLPSPVEVKEIEPEHKNLQSANSASSGSTVFQTASAFPGSAFLQYSPSPTPGTPIYTPIPANWTIPQSPPFPQFSWTPNGSNLISASSNGLVMVHPTGNAPQELMNSTIASYFPAQVFATPAGNSNDSTASTAPRSLQAANENSNPSTANFQKPTNGSSKISSSAQISSGASAEESKETDLSQAHQNASNLLSISKQSSFNRNSMELGTTLDRYRLSSHQTELESEDLNQDFTADGDIAHTLREDAMTHTIPSFYPPQVLRSTGLTTFPNSELMHPFALDPNVALQLGLHASGHVAMNLAAVPVGIYPHGLGIPQGGSNLSSAAFAEEDSDDSAEQGLDRPSRRKRRESARKNLVFRKTLENSGPFSHIRIWTDDKGTNYYDCDCGSRKPVQNLSKIKKHLKLHNSLMYTCPQCGKEFHHYLQLNAHKKIHKVADPYTAYKKTLGTASDNIIDTSSVLDKNAPFAAIPAGEK